MKHAMNQAFENIGIQLSDLSEDRPWTSDGDRTLDDYFIAGYTIYEISIEFRRTIPDIIGRLIKHFLEQRIRPQDFGIKTRSDNERALHCMDKNVGVYRLTDENGRPRKKKYTRKQWADYEKQQALSMREDGDTIKKIAKHFGVSDKTMRTRFAEWE